MSEVEFPQGLIIKEPHAKAPDYVKASISIKREDLITWLEGRSEEWINLDVKESKKGGWYAAVNTFKKKSQPDDTLEPF